MLDLRTDGDGYPTTETLTIIEEFSDWRKINDLFAAIKSIWTYSDAFLGPLNQPPKEVLPLVHRELDCQWYRLATMGWSGNELIITALEKNIIVQAFCWYMSARGGLHIYKVGNIK